MFWSDTLVKNLQSPQIINDSKTPSGRVHVGALRGVLIHDAVFRALKDHGVPARYLYGVDDYDPLDELPAGHKAFFEPYLGMPLCNVPPIPGSDHQDMAEHFFSEFKDVFDELSVQPEIYRMRDIYLEGRFNEPIARILEQADKVREIYQQVSGSERSPTWHPFQAICEQCGRIGTTEVYHFDGKEVSYRCRPDLVAWAQGCGYEGKRPPFDGQGKLVWKLEWVAKWATFPVSIEGAGKDHSTKGGSRDVSSRCLSVIFGKQPPLNIPYEFFLVGGAKMSSSKGLGVSAREMADFLPPEILRFLMIKAKPNKPVNFEPDEQNITKLFNEFDRAHQRYFSGKSIAEDEKRIYNLSAPEYPDAAYLENFQIVTTLVQMPHLDLEKEVARRKGSELTDLERKRLQDRVDAATYWLNHYAQPEERTVLQRELPASASELSHAQRAFLNRLADKLETSLWSEDILQAHIFTVARTTPIRQPIAFQAIYCVLLARASGPKAGNLLAFLDRTFVINRFRELAYCEADFLREVSVDVKGFIQAIEFESRRHELKSFTTKLQSIDDQSWVLRVSYRGPDDRLFAKSILFQPPEGQTPQEAAQHLLHAIRARVPVKLDLST